MGVTVLPFIFFQTFHIIVASAFLQSLAERRTLDNSDGFININCGMSFGNEIVRDWRGLKYTSDDGCISSGENQRVQVSVSQGTRSYFLTPFIDNLFATLRSFPDGRRNCYTLSVSVNPNNKYLIRVRFWYGNYDGKQSFPGFDVYIGVNFWFTFSNQDTSIYGYSYKEIIHVAIADSIHVCLVNTGNGTPFLSSLELRPMNHTSYPASPSFSLVALFRDHYADFDSTSGSNELKDDVYDRLWHSNPTWSGCKVITDTKISFHVSQGNVTCRVPTSVLRTACEQNETWTYSMADTTSDHVYVYWHFAELELPGLDDTREFNILVTTDDSSCTFGPIQLNYLQVTTVAPSVISLNGSGFFNYRLEKTYESIHQPILNAMEVYSVLDLPKSPSNQEDVDAVTAIKNSYALQKIWQGDPCLPANYEWEGLNCTYIDNNPPRITSLILSSWNLTGDVSPSLSNLTSLVYLNLSNNGLTGKMPDFLAVMPALKVIDLTGNNLMGRVPHQLAKNARKKSIDLRLQGNRDVCKSYPCSGKEHSFIIKLVTTVISVLLFMIFGIIFLVLKWRKNPETGVGRTIFMKNKQFSSSDIARMTDSFKTVLGRGGFGIVYYGVL